MSVPRSNHHPNRRSTRSPLFVRSKAEAARRHPISSSRVARKPAAAPAAIPSGSCVTATSVEGLKEKVGFTVRDMESRLAEFGFGWKDTTAAQAYTVHDFHPVMTEELVRRGAMRSGLTWHFARPPVVDLEFEMDCRRVSREVVV